MAGALKIRVGDTWKIVAVEAGAGDVADGSVSTAKLADDAVTQAKLADNSVGNAQMRDDAVTKDELADDAVEAAAIKDGAVGTDALAADAVTGAKIADDAVGASAIADGAVGAAALADDGVTPAKLDADTSSKKTAVRERINAASADPDAFSALTFAAALTWDVGAKPNATVTLTGNVTGLTLSNAVDGGVYTLLITQDGTGSRTFAFPSAWKWAGGSADSISGGASDVDMLVIRMIGSAIYAAPILKDLS